MTAGPPKPKNARRLRQFSLRTLLLVLVAASVAIGVLTHRANEQRRAVELIRPMGGSVEYAHPLESGERRDRDPR